MLKKAGQNGRMFEAGIILILVLLHTGCSRLRLPAIDPSGGRVFLPAPNSTGLLTSQANNPAFSPNIGSGNVVPGPGPSNVNPMFQPPSFPQLAPNANSIQSPNQPAFQAPPTPPPCDAPLVSQNRKRYLIPDPGSADTPSELGEIIMTPSRIVAPVGSEVVVLAGVCGGDGFFVKNQPLEWMLSNNSVGEFIEVGGMHHPNFNRLIPPTAKKFSGQYAWGRTGLKKVVLSRGTPTPVDDIELAEGQTFVSVSSASPGTSYVTAVAPKAQGWDKRRSSTTIHWVDGNWSIPVPSRATAGTVFPLTTVVNRTNGSGLKGWEVRYSIVGGAPAEFAPAGSQKAEATTNSDGQATVQIRQPAGQFDPGTTQVRVDVVRPPVFGEQELIVESGITSVTWSAPALTIRAIGPKQADADTPFNYRIEVTNPGDQVARNVIVRTRNLPDGVEYIGSTPKPTEYGRDYQWALGDIAPNSPPKLIDVQLKSGKRGNVNMCFEVSSQEDDLRTEACTQTEIVLPCIGFSIDGPNSVRLGENATFNINVENQCNAPLENIRITVRHDAGLARPGKQNPATFDYPLLQFGESRSLPITFNAQAQGEQCFVVEVSARNVRTQSERRCVEVLDQGDSSPPTTDPNSPLSVEINRPGPVRVGEKVNVDIEVTNRGTVTLNDVTLINRNSQSILSTDTNKPWEIKGDELWIDVGTIPPGQTVLVRVVYEGVQVDPDARTEFTINSVAGSTFTSTGIQVVAADGAIPNPGAPNSNEDPIGIPGDDGQGLRDPSVGATQNLEVRVETIGKPTIGVGERTEVRITVTNNFQQSIRDVGVTLLVPNSIPLVQFDSSQSRLGLQNNDAPFYTIKKALELRAGESLIWIATVQGQTAGQSRLEAQASSVDVVGNATGSDVVVVQ